MFDMYQQQNYEPFQERDLDKIVDLFDWFRPEDLVFLHIYFSGVVGLALGLYTSPLNFDIFFLFGKNGVIYPIHPGLYLVFIFFGIPSVYLMIVTKIRKKYTKGYLGKKIKRITHSKVGKKYSPFEKYLFNDL